MNALAAADPSAVHTINFGVPPTEPNCEAATGTCAINLAKELPQVTASVTFAGPGADRLTVRRDSNVAYMVRAFIESVEYRQRFGGAPGGNQQGALSAAGGEP